jgi:beta-phosphoglucomutase
MTQPSISFRGIIFDMDGVLCASEPFIAAAAIAMFRKRFGVEVAEHEFHDFVGTGEDRFIGGVAERRGLALQMPADKELTYDCYDELVRGKLQALPGVVAVTTAARAAGLRLAVASAADRRKVVTNLTEIGVGPERFDVVITGSDVARKKPHPDGFLLAAERLGLQPGECLVVEDAINGIQAARAAGSRALGLTTSFSAEQLLAAGAWMTAGDLSLMPGAVKEALGL